MGVAILLVIAYHWTEDFSNYYDDAFDGPAQTFYRYVGSSGVDVFLVLSGIGLYYSWRRRPDARSFYRKRMSRVLIPYAIVALIGWIWADFVHSHAGMVRFLGDITFVTFFTDGVRWFWYVLVSFICYAIFPKVFAALDGAADDTAAWLRTLLLCSLCLVLIVMLDLYEPDLYGNIDLAVNRIPSFIVGCLFGRLAYEHATFSMGGVCAGFTLVAVLLYPLQMATTPVIAMLLRALLMVLACFIAVVLFDRMASGGAVVRCIHGSTTGMLSWCGRYSLELYLLHVMVRKMMRYDTIHPLNELFLIAVCVALAIPLKWISSLLQRRVDGTAAAANVPRNMSDR